MVPSGVDLKIVVEAEDVARGSRSILEAMDAAATPIVTEWEMPARGRALRQKPGDRRKALDAALSTPAPPPESLALELEGKWLAGVGQPHGTTGQISLLLMARGDHASPPEALAIFTRLCRELLERTRVVSAYTNWTSSPEYLPELPIAVFTRQLVITSAAEVEAAYERPDAFWNAWDTRVERGDRVMLVRAAQARDSVEYLRAVLDGQWEMARAAKPKRTRYFATPVAPEEMELFRRGDTPLETVGYIAEDRLVEMSCVLPSGSHIPGWQITALLQVIRSKQLPDGRPLDALRVVFLRRADAEQEKRPLLDIGAQVYWQSDRGELERITD